MRQEKRREEKRREEKAVCLFSGRLSNDGTVYQLRELQAERSRQGEQRDRGGRNRKCVDMRNEERRRDREETYTRDSV